MTASIPNIGLIRRGAFIAAALAATIASAQTSAPTTRAASLKVGDAAPPLMVGKWLKGEPVKSFEPGTVYVIECWATWCGPCIAAIPHVSELQKKYDGKVVVIGMNVFEEDDAKAAAFVAAQGEKMAYRVAADDKSTDADGATLRTWLAAAGLETIPTTFVVDQKGKLAWIGLPNAMDAVVERVVAGTYDEETGAEQQAKTKAAIAKLNAAAKAKDPEAGLAAIDELTALDPKMAREFAVQRFRYQLQAHQADAAYASVDELSKTFDDDATSLAQFAAAIAVAPGVERRDLPVARKLAERAVEVSKRANTGMLEVLARVAHDQGDSDAAIATIREAVEKAKGAAGKARFQKTLDEYQGATTKPAAVQ